MLFLLSEVAGAVDSGAEKENEGAEKENASEVEAESTAAVVCELLVLTEESEAANALVNEKPASENEYASLETGASDAGSEETAAGGDEAKSKIAGAAVEFVAEEVERATGKLKSKFGSKLPAVLASDDSPKANGAELADAEAAVAVETVEGTRDAIDELAVDEKELGALAKSKFGLSLLPLIARLDIPFLSLSFELENEEASVTGAVNSKFGENGTGSLPMNPGLGMTAHSSKSACAEANENAEVCSDVALTASSAAVLNENPPMIVFSKVKC